MTITHIDGRRARAITTELIAVLADFAKRNNVAITDAGGTLGRGGTSAVFKLEISVIDAKGVAQTPGAASFAAYAASYGLKSDDLNKEFVSPRGERYRLTGISPSRPKFPIDGIRVSDGEHFKFPISMVRHGLVLGSFPSLKVA